MVSVFAGVSKILMAVSALVWQLKVLVSAGVSQIMVSGFAGVSKLIVAVSAVVCQLIVLISVGVSQLHNVAVYVRLPTNFVSFCLCLPAITSFCWCLPTNVVSFCWCLPTNGVKWTWSWVDTIAVVPES
jgi:hypothetical protein